MYSDLTCDRCAWLQLRSRTHVLVLPFLGGCGNRAPRDTGPHTWYLSLGVVPLRGSHAAGGSGGPVTTFTECFREPLPVGAQNIPGAGGRCPSSFYHQLKVPAAWGFPVASQAVRPTALQM